MSLQAEEARDWEDPEEKLEEEKDENHKEVQTFPQETEEEEASPKKTNERTRKRRGGEEEDVGETEAVMDETDSQLKEFSTEDIMSDQNIRDFETVGKHSATGDLGMDIPGLFNISRLEADQSDSLLWSEQSDWIQGQAEDADRSEGAYGDDDDDDMLHSVQSRESDSSSTLIQLASGTPPLYTGLSVSLILILELKKTKLFIRVT
ncbi:hypothetical protein F7725_019034 [Dissostichus mawsoni]|uniref:Uncharacterized protein n=1 Tax=Dissostichus mawsoni TaxID=36200 RepID=A0A7J5XUV5_DISMA|nr:hypothetical protein F7725_019034 [Dissostichus mawsoni]